MKRIAVLTLCAVLISATCASAMSEWAKPEAEAANQSGLITESLLWGSVTENITREEFCYLAMNLYKNMGGQDTEITENPFADTQNKAVIEAYSLGIINGKTDTLFYPDAPITRQEIAKIIMLTVNAVSERQTTQNEVCELCRFEDFEDVNEWAADFVAGAVRHEIINGVTLTRLFPQGYATREQAIAIMNRAYVEFAESTVSYEVPDIISIDEKNPDTIAIKWNKTKDAKAYSIIIRDKDKNVIITQESDTPNCEIKTDELPYGTYSVIVGARVGDYAVVYSGEDNFTKTPEEYVEKYPTIEDKLNRVFPEGKAFEDYETAQANMTKVTVPVWKLKENGEKYSSELTVEVNTNLAEDIVKIFTEIYNDPERFPIKNIGGFSWRNTAFGSTSEHSYGTCIDINWEENYYCYADSGEAITGSFWKPYENPYSIPADGSVVRVFKKYGFDWGGDAWPTLRDYMHFTYLGK